MSNACRDDPRDSSHSHILYRARTPSQTANLQTLSAAQLHMVTAVLFRGETESASQITHDRVVRAVLNR